MEFWQVLSPVITAAAALGTIVAAFSAYRSKTDIEVLRSSNIDLRASNEDYKSTIDTLKSANIALTKRVQSLEDEKKLPLEDLTKLVVLQHTQQLKVLRDIATALNKSKVL
jgi:predicted histidine transporter YuiF (NhaC family)